MSRTPVASALWSSRAWLGADSSQAWASNVLLEVDGNGCWSNITAGVSREDAQRQGATVLLGLLLPGIVNAHSHAFQRAFAGLAERRDSEHDDFWSWRDRMYRVALAISPQQLKAVPHSSIWNCYAAATPMFATFTTCSMRRMARRTTIRSRWLGC